MSPAWLFNGQLPASFDPKTIRLRRTQLLAELELTGITMEYHGETLTKNDILTLFDEVTRENALAWHIAIAKDKTLLTFLEDIHFDHWAVDNHCVRYLKNPLYEDEEFIRWLSPYYSDSFMFYMEINCLKASNVHALVALLDTPVLMTQADQEQAWQATIRLMDKPIDQIRRYGTKAASEAELAKTGAWMEEEFLQLVRLLPEEYFGPVRDKYALTIFEACENVRRKSPQYPNRIDRWTENAIGLAYSPETKNQLLASHKKNSLPLARLQRWKAIPLRVWIMIIVGLIFCYWIGHRR